MTNINDIKRELENSAIFNMSLSSKELFHSNFWAWLMNQDDIGLEFIKVFFPSIKDNSYKVEREKDNMDILITYKNKKYVIENKFKSIPSIDQLNRYTDKLIKKDSFSSGVLTGIDEPLFKMPTNWKFLDYEKISNKITSVSDNLKNSDSRKQYLKDYAKMLNGLSKLLNEYKKYFKDSLPCFDTKDSNYNKQLKETVEELRLSDLCQKHQECFFLNKLIREPEYIKLEKTVKNAGFSLMHCADFTRASYCMTLRIIKNRDTENEMHIGLQLQGNEYRITAEKLFYKDDDENKEKVFNDNDFNDWFIKSGKCKDGTKHTEEFCDSNMQKPYCSFCSKKSLSNKKTNRYYAFVYQYWNITSKNNKYDILKKTIIKDLEKALKLMKKTIR